MPTGGGKSVTFQVPSLMMDGVCIVITPLIALMKDQVARLRDLRIKATAIYSGLSRNDILRNLDNCILGDYKFLYVSPERLSSELFQAKLAHMKVNFITVDEAHCISQWGYDFRPSYLQISLTRKLKPEAPILALTATATPVVVRDIQTQLQFRKENVFRMSFERTNLSYIVQPVLSKESTLIDLLRNNKGSAIVYTRNRDKTAEIAKLLTANGIDALHYHAGLENADKDMRQQLWQDDMVRVIVATNAFGMGIDKADVRLVIHIGVPDSIEAYFQEAGRAGRDGKPAQAILLKGQRDVSNLKRHINTSFPTKDFVREIYEQICYRYEIAIGDGYNIRREFNLTEFCQQRKYFPLSVLSAFRILEHAGYLQYTEPEDSTSCAKVVMEKSELYRLGQLPPRCEKVLQALLRSYNGLFADLMPIEEILLAQRTELKPSEVYESLRTLQGLGVLYYIPFKHVAHIRFMQSRVDTSELILSKAVYDDRRMELVTRVGAMINYLEAQNRCRSRILLEYFGQTDSADCGQCDVCQAHGYTRNPSTGANTEHVAEIIINLLADGNQHSFTELRELNIPINTIKQVLEKLSSEGEITYDNGLISIS